jgi:hypothetical protein
MRLLVVLIGCLGLAACDGWPTSFANQTAGVVGFSYRQKSYDHPSTVITYTAGARTLLAREHSLRDFTEIRVIDGDHTHVFAGERLDGLKAACPQYQCELIYRGDGNLIARPWTEPMEP